MSINIVCPIKHNSSLYLFKMAYFEVFYSFFFTSSHSPLNAQGRVLYGYLAIILHYIWRWLNDTWNIVGIASQAKAKIYIFDCYVDSLNKTVRQERNGMVLITGHQPPSSAYWFTLEYTDPLIGELNQLKSHFTIKR